MKWSGEPGEEYLVVDGTVARMTLLVRVVEHNFNIKESNTVQDAYIRAKPLRVADAWVMEYLRKKVNHGRRSSQPGRIYFVYNANVSNCIQLRILPATHRT